MSEQIIGRLDEMGKRVEDLEKNIEDLMQQVDTKDDAKKWTKPLSIAFSIPLGFIVQHIVQQWYKDNVIQKQFLFGIVGVQVNTKMKGTTLPCQPAGLQLIAGV